MNMPKFNALRSLRPWHLRPITITLLLGLVTLFVTSAWAAVPVAISPVPKLQFFDASGRPLAFGCVFTYVSGTTTPLTTYTDSTGSVANSQPVDLDAGGFAGSGSSGIWLQAGQAYTLKVVSSGGSHCASGATLYSVDGIGGGLTLLTTIVTFSATPSFPIQAQNQLFEITLTGNAVAQPLTAVGILPPAWVAFQITQDAAGGHTFTWPSNSIGGAPIGLAPNQVTTQLFLWNGLNATAVGPAITGNGPAISIGSLTASGTLTAGGLISTCTNPATAGFIRLCKTDAINWRNNANGADQGFSQDASDRLLASFAGGLVTTGAVPDLFLGGVTASFPRLKRNSTAINFRLGDDSADAGITASSGGFSGAVTGASYGCGILSKTANYTLAATDCIVHVSASGGSFQITIPHAITGKLWQVTRTDTSTNVITIAGDSGNTNTIAAIKLAPGTTYLCHADGTDSWCLMSPATLNGQLTQSARLTGCGATCTFTYTVPYSATPNCVCAGEGGSCNVSTVSTTQCVLNTTVVNNQVIVVGIP